MVDIKSLRKRIAITLGVSLVAGLLTAAPALAANESLTITKVAFGATASDSFPFTLTKAAGSNNNNIYPDGSPSVAFNLDSSNGLTKTFSGFQNATTGVVESPNNYTITESTPAGWNAPIISCQDTNPDSSPHSNISFNYGSSSVSFEYTPNPMVPGAHIVCTFTNTRKPVVTIATTVSAETITAGSSGYDSATLTNATGGSLTYNLFAGTCPAQVVNVPIFSSSVSVSNTGVVPDSLPYTFNTAGSYYWVTVYTPASSSPIVTGPCEPLTVTPPVVTQLTVTKVIVGPSGNPDTFTLQIFNSYGTLIGQAPNIGNGGSMVTGVGAGTFNVSETGANLSQYTVTYTGDCAPTGSVTLVAGDNKFCTITNTKIVPATATLTVIKRVLPVIGNPNKFNLIITGPAGSLGNGTTPNVGDLGTTGAVTITSGLIYTVSETAGSGGTILSDYTTVFSGACATDGTVNLAAGASGICTITNTRKTTTLTVIKEIIGSSGLQDIFSLHLLGPNGYLRVFHTSVNFLQMGPHAVSPGSYLVSEFGDNLSQYTAVYSGDCDLTGAVTMIAGDNKTCTITNTKKATATLTVIKELLPNAAAAGSLNKFNLIITGPSGSLGSGTTLNVGHLGTTGAVTITAGVDYIVSESAGSGDTILSQYTTVYSGACSSAGVVNLAANTSGVCIIKNTLKMATLTVIKRTLPSTGNPDSFNLLITGSPGSLHSGRTWNVFQGTNSHALNITAGVDYVVSESAGTGGTNLSDYTTVFSGACSSTGIVNLAVGATGICTITNTKNVPPTATLTVIKQLVPSVGNLNKFNLIIGPTGSLGTGTTLNVGNLGTTGPVTITAGVDYIVSESAGSGGTVLSDYTTVFTGACNSSGIVNLATGASGTCTITNTKKGLATARLAIMKVLVPAIGNPDTFNLIIGPLGYLGSSTRPNVGNVTSAPQVTITAGVNYEVSESAFGSTNLSHYTATFSGACSSTGIVNLAAGATGLCTITNTRITAKLTVIKILVPSVGNPNKFNLIITGPIGSLGNGTTPNIGNLGTTGPVAITSGLDYNVSESAGSGGTNLSGYTTVFTGNCSSTGIVNLAVNTSGICTITNIKKGHAPATLTVIKRLLPSAGNPNKFNLIIGPSGLPGSGTWLNRGHNQSTGAVTITSGLDYNVSESVGSGGTNLSGYTTVFTGACSPTGIVNLAANTSGICTITNKLVWTTKASMPTSRYYLGAGVINGILYVVGGQGSGGSSYNKNTLEAYNPATNTWTTKASLPTDLRGLGAGVINGILYVVGGRVNVGNSSNATSALRAYNPSTNTWTTKTAMPSARAGLAVGVVNGILYAVGGESNGGAALATLQAYNPATNTWTTKAAMPSARSNIGVGVANGIIYAVGGKTGNFGSDLSIVDAYNPATNTWTSKAPVAFPRRGPGVGVINGVLHVIGGAGGAGPAYGQMQAYDPGTNTWTTKPPMLTPRGFIGVGVVNGVLYTVGGSLGTYASTVTVEAYTP